MNKQQTLRFTEADLEAYRARESGFSLTPSPKATESDTQRAILALLEKHPAVAFAFRVNTASGFLVSASAWKSLLAGAVAKAFMARFIRFAFPGCSDIIGMLKGGRLFACEVKAADGAATEDQIAFLARVNQHGGLGFIARSVDDVVRHIPTTHI